MFDTHSADSVEIVIRDGKVWVNVDGVCQFRAYSIKKIDLNDERWDTRMDRVDAAGEDA